MKPEWVTEMPVGQWCRISGNSPDLGLPATPRGTRFLEDNDPANDLALNPARSLTERMRRMIGKRPSSAWHGRSGFTAITEAWNSAILASRFGVAGSMVVFGGGHDDYFGSDMHAFDLDTRRWSRISDGYVSGHAGAYGAGAIYPSSEYPDGSPLPPHTYDYLQYSPTSNDCVLIKGQIELGPNVRAVAVPHMFNFDTLSWRKGPKHPTAVLNSGGFAAWDGTRNKIWGHSGDAGGGNAFLSFDPSGENPDGTYGNWADTFPNKLVGVADHNAMAIDAVRDIIVMTVATRNELCALDPNHPELPVTHLHSSPSKPFIQEYAALEYSRNLDSFVYYSAVNGAAIHKITAPIGERWEEWSSGIWDWKSLQNVDSLNPIVDAYVSSARKVNLSHTFGRFRIATYDEIDIAILVRHVDSPVYALRLT